MKNDKDQKNSSHPTSTLQAEIDTLLADLGHLFDTIAEYGEAHTADSVNLIDIDEVLNMEIRITKRAAKNEQSKNPWSSYEHALSKKTRLPYRTFVPTNHFPQNPKKAIVAMPENMQKTMRTASGHDKIRNIHLFGFRKAL